MSDPRPPIGEGEDVEALHRQLVREQAEPEDGREPAPWYVWALVVTSLFVGGWYLGRYGGPFDTTTHAPIPGLAPPPEVAGQAARPVDGAVVYTRCATCHQADGRGVPGAFPPLVGSEWVTGPPDVPIRIVLHGLTGPIDVAGVRYDGVMPGWATQMDDAEVAAVVAHVRELAGVSPPDVPVELVTQVRAETEGRTAPYTAAELLGGAP